VVTNAKYVAVNKFSAILLTYRNVGTMLGHQHACPAGAEIRALTALMLPLLCPMASVFGREHFRKKSR
jgi:hypothetical protein